MTLLYNDGNAEIHDFSLGAAVVTDTEWVLAIHVKEFTASAEALVAGDIVQVRGHGGIPDTPPAAADLGFQIGGDLTADGAIQAFLVPTFLKMIKSDNTGGGVTTGELLLRIGR